MTDIREAHETLQRLNSELERRVRERTAELERSNQDLEQFSYAVSHDLQAPLRTISGFIGLLKKRHGPQLDAEGQELLRFIEDGAQRMHAMIADVLLYARAGKDAGASVPVAMDAALDTALANLRAALDESGAEVVREPLPTVTGDPVRITQLWQNLVGNAIKFRGAAPPRIRISVQEQPDAWVFAVADNGIGIAADAGARLFRLFQRLHTSDKVPGTGVGLALCKRIVETHGGRIGFESRVGEGSTFRFTWPRRHP